MTGSRRRPVRTPVGQRLRAAAPPVLALALVGVAALLPNPDDGSRPPVPVPVSRAAYACPSGTSVALGQVSPGDTVVAREVPGGRRRPSMEHPDRWRRTQLTDSALVIEQVGRRSGAAGFFARTLGAEEGGGLTVGACPGTVDQSWYLGLGSGAKHLSRVILTNLSDVVAVADLAMWGSQGPIEEVGARGVVIKPRSVQVIELSKFAAEEPDLALRVNRRRGALAVTVLDGSQRVFAGSEAMPPTRIPSKRQFVGGIPANPKGRSLVILNPGSATARVTATVLGHGGPIVPQGLQSVAVGAGSVKNVDLPPGIGSGPVSIRLDANEPIVAGARFDFGKTDYAAAVSARALDGPALIPVELGAGVERPRLTLTALGRSAQVAITGYDAGMNVVGRATVDLDASTTKSVRLTTVGDAAYAVVRTRGPVIGAALFQTADGVASVPLEAAPMRVLGPNVRPAS